eukprot:2667388-Amphidinium_carterae.1
MPVLENETVECDRAWACSSCDPPYSRLDMNHVTCDLKCAWYLVWSGVCYSAWIWSILGHMGIEAGWTMVQHAKISVPPA